MLTVYHSNQLDLLKTIIATLITSKPLHDPLQPEVILVQSNGMAQWIQMELAAHFGVAANIEFPLPASFIWQMCTRLLPNIPDESAFTKDSMTWRLMTLIPHLCQQPEFTTIKEYLRDDNDKRKILQFATQIADLFDQYLIYRPYWLESWQSGKLINGIGDAQCWQAQLWRMLIVEIEKAGQSTWHRANIYQHFIKTLSQCQIRPPGLPDRVFICGISVLPPIYLQALQALGLHIDIHLLFTNPCRYYWGDIYDRAFLLRLLHRRRKHYKQQTDQALFRRPEQSYELFNTFGEQQIGNQLLASWGKQGRDSLYLLTQMDDIAEVDAFVEPIGNSLLNILQRDILALEEHTVINSIESETFLAKESGKRLLQLNDRSISIHVCHSPQREVEILHDSLLAMMTEDMTLRPRDVIVMVADIDYYTPAIQAVFSNVSSKRYLPFSVSDKKTRHLHPVLSAFLILLELPHSRFTAEQVLSLLEVPALAARFAIDDQGLQLLRLWVAESGIRWGLDDDMSHELMLPATGQHTWQFGLTRMLLGYAMDSESGDWQGILPYDEFSGLIATSLVGQLAELLMRLRQWRDRLIQPRTLNSWFDCASEIIEDFFAPDTEAEVALVLLKNQWQKLLQCGLQVGYNQPVSVTLLQKELSARLDQDCSNPHFLAGVINFCTLMPMRSIPFRVVCLLGMNDGIYPCTLPSASFNLMAQKPQRGDRSRRDDDRYLFLEALLSAQQRLYISFIGRAIQDNTPCYPSVLVNELSNYIAQSFYLPGDEYIDAESSTDRVRVHLWQWHSRTPFTPDNFLPNSEIQSFADEWLPAAEANSKPSPDFITPLPELPCKTLSLDELLRFYRHPVRAWFMQRLEVSFHQTTIGLEADEPFVIDGLTRYNINYQIMNALIDGKSTDCLLREVRAAGLLPYGAFGELHWARQCQDMTMLFELMRPLLSQETHNLEVYLILDKITFSGWLPRVQMNGLLRWRPGKLSSLDGLLLWLEHLAYCAMGGEGESFMFGTQGRWHFTPIPSYLAKTFLFSLVSGYRQGMTSPLLLLPRASSAWISHCYNSVTQNIDCKKNRQQQARNKLIQAWQGNDYIPGENKDLYLQRLIPHLEEHHIDAIISAAKQYLLPPFIFNKPCK